MPIREPYGRLIAGHILFGLHCTLIPNCFSDVQIAVNFLQVTSVAIAINADWSEAIENTLAIQGEGALWTVLY